MTLVREHRGELAESMKTVREVKDRGELFSVVSATLNPFGFITKPEQIKIEKYGYDERIDWDTHLITVEGYGVWGMSDGDLL